MALKAVPSKTMEATEGESSTGPHRMRISSGGNVSSYVKFALEFLQNNPTRPLILHTRPAPLSAPGTSAKPQPRSTSTLQPCTLAAPRLISVAEIVKREYMTIINGSGKGKGKHKAVGIWQYTKSGLVDPNELGLGIESGGTGDGSDGLVRILEGKIKPKMTHYPYLEITLSTQPLGLDKDTDTSCQYILAARHRNRGTGKDGKENEDDEGHDQTMPGIEAAGQSIPVAKVGKTPESKDEDIAMDGQEKVDAKGVKGKKRKSKSLEGVEGAKAKKIKA